MEAKRRAYNLVRKFEDHSHYHNEDSILTEREVGKKNAKSCALIAVDEIINLGFLTCGVDHERTPESQLYYWGEVKDEINKL